MSATLLLNIISCNIDDPEIFEQIFSDNSINFPVDNKIMHIINHYLSIQNNFKRLSSYPHCHAS